MPRLLAEPDTAEGLPNEYLVELVARFNDDGLDQVRRKVVMFSYTIYKQSSIRLLALHW